MNDNIIEIECDKNWLLDYLEPWDYTNIRRYKNYLAIVSRDESGEFVYHWCKESQKVMSISTLLKSRREIS